MGGQPSAKRNILHIIYCVNSEYHKKSKYDSPLIMYVKLYIRIIMSKMVDTNKLNTRFEMYGNFNYILF